MKFTYSWLKDFLDTTASTEEVATTLTNIGLEVEGLEDIGATLAPFVVAKIEEAEKHPDADKLKVCKVNDGNTVRQIVCGAPNARAGIYVVLATEGVCIPGNGMTIKQAKIRGVESNGMLCSGDELGLGGDSDGIIELAGEPAPGSSVAEALGMNDVVFDIAITPNRGDCFGIYGVARDLAAAGIGTLKDATIPQISAEITHQGASKITVTSATNACPHYIGCTISGVENKESPEWLKQRLTLIGQQPISALVDITNYMTIAFGRPAHVYDIAKLSGSALEVRGAEVGEKITALDHKEYALLSEEAIVIADGSGPVAIGGIIGSEPSGCDENTKDVFLEIALFDPISVAETGQALTLSTDARMRFERGIDTAFLEQGAKLATQMILDLCGGEASELVISGAQPTSNDAITLKHSLIKRLTSLEVSADRVKEILTSLGFDVNGDGNEWQINAPSWRHDVSVAEDLVEEIARIEGYENIAAIPLPAASIASAKHRNISLERLGIARRLLAGLGMVELHNWTFVSEAQAQDVGELNPALKLANPISSELSVMRSSLLPHLLSSAERNANKGVKDIAIFEVGQVFNGTEYSDQKTMIAGLLTGTKQAHAHTKEQFSAADTAYNMYDAKAAILNVLAAFGVNVEQLSLTADAPDTYHPGRSMRLSLGGKVTLGYAGQLHPMLTDKHDLDKGAVYFEIDVANVPVPKQKTTTKKALALSPYPSVERDFAFTVDEAVEVEKLRRAALKADKKLITAAHIFDVYQGKHMDAGKKSVALRVVLESFDKTLTDEEIGQVSDNVISQVNSATGAELRC